LKVYLYHGDGERRLVGCADMPVDSGPVYEAHLLGAESVLTERFAIGAVTRLPDGGGAPMVERAVMAAPGQPVELLPGWMPLAS